MRGRQSQGRRTEIERMTDRKTDWQTDRQTDREAEKRSTVEAGGERKADTETVSGRQTDRQTGRNKKHCSDRVRKAERELRLTCLTASSRDERPRGRLRNSQVSGDITRHRRHAHHPHRPRIQGGTTHQCACASPDQKYVLLCVSMSM